MTEMYLAEGICLRRDPGSDKDLASNRVRCPNNPFIAAGTDKAIIDDHGGIWSDSFKRWLTSLIKEMEKKA